MSQIRETLGRRGLLRRIAGGVALGIAGVAAGRLLLPAAPMPPLLSDLPDEPGARDRAFADRVVRRFPPGHAEAALRQQLAEQGFAIHSDARRAEWQHASGNCHEFAQVTWAAAEGRVTTTGGVAWRLCR